MTQTPKLLKINVVQDAFEAGDWQPLLMVHFLRNRCHTPGELLTEMSSPQSSWAYLIVKFRDARKLSGG
jgi:hypothetical protein